MKLNIILPTRNNLKYLKWAYASIRKNQGKHDVQICLADDASTDGTWDWITEIQKSDSNVHAIRNEGPARVGHTILYDRIINELVPDYEGTEEIWEMNQMWNKSQWCMIFHADMYLTSGALDALEKSIMYEMLQSNTPNKVFSLTRIEPDLHPVGKEKIVVENAPIEPEDFTEEWMESTMKDVMEWRAAQPKDFTTPGVFAPWAFEKRLFVEVGGHDPVFAPQSKEDSDIWNRLKIMGTKFIQTWDGFVYHMTCRGSRFNPMLTTPGKNSTEWEAQNARSTRNFLRKWKTYPLHTELLDPIVIDKPLLPLVVYYDPQRSQALNFEPVVDFIVGVPHQEVDRYLIQYGKESNIDISKKFVDSDGVNFPQHVINITGMNYDWGNLLLDYPILAHSTKSVTILI